MLFPLCYHRIKTTWYLIKNTRICLKICLGNLVDISSFLTDYVPFANYRIFGSHGNLSFKRKYSYISWFFNFFIRSWVLAMKICRNIWHPTLCVNLLSQKISSDFRSLTNCYDRVNNNLVFDVFFVPLRPSRSQPRLLCHPWRLPAQEAEIVVGFEPAGLLHHCLVRDHWTTSTPWVKFQFS